VHKEFVPDGKTVSEFYKGVIDCLLKCIQLVRPAAFWSQDFFLLLHDNAPTQEDASVLQFLTPKNVTTLYHPPPPPPPHFFSPHNKFFTPL